MKLIANFAFRQLTTNISSKLRLLTIVVIFVAIGACATCVSADEERPNIILILTDDQGWTDTSVAMIRGCDDSRSDFYRTPALERLAREGMVFSSAYSAAPTCTPSRASLQFGKTPARLRQSVVHDSLAASRGIDLHDETSIAQAIKSADRGYVTAHFGKWGFHPRTPEHALYDVTDGNTNNGEGDYLSVRDRTPLPEDDPKRIFSVTQRALRFMTDQVAADRPFFMQVSHYAVHVDTQARPETVARVRNYPRGKKCTDTDYADPQPRPGKTIIHYGAMIEDLDTGVGLLLAKLDELDIADNTYIIFTSDNSGGFRGNGPLRGGKANLWEGGIRVPTVVRGPGVKRASQCDVPIAAWDFLPTVCDLIGSAQPVPDGVDGGSLRDLFARGNDGNITRGTEPLVFHFPWYGGATPTSAIRLGDYKLIKNLSTGETRLYNLADDLGETNDLSTAMPDKTRELQKHLTDYLASVDAETLADMLAARRAELDGYIARSQDWIETFSKRLTETGDEQERRRLEEQIAGHRRMIEANRATIEREATNRAQAKW